MKYFHRVTEKINGIIAQLIEVSYYFVLEECQIRRDECIFVGSKMCNMTVRQLTGFVVFGDKEFVRLKWSNEK